MKMFVNTFFSNWIVSQVSGVENVREQKDWPIPRWLARPGQAAEADSNPNHLEVRVHIPGGAAQHDTGYILFLRATAGEDIEE